MQSISKKNIIEVGLDEVARGCMFGRVYTAAVIWPEDYVEDPNYIIKDSKKLSKKKREELYYYIIDTAIDWNINYIENNEIDKLNILQATMKSMHNNLDNLLIDVDHILVDGTNFNPYKKIPYTCIVKGDDKYYSIAAASILAKVEHDWYIEELCKKKPELHEKYDLLNNMGYGTKNHMDNIKKYGISEYHRRSFGICKNY
jgi:ribonuclease HII